MNSEQMKLFIIKEDANIVEALQQIDTNAKGILFVVDINNKLVGSITDGDIRRWLIKTADLNGKIKSIMNQNPKTTYLKDIDEIHKLLKKNSITSMPIIRYNNEILDIIFLEDDLIHGMKNKALALSDISVVIMAGGKGTRLYPYTKILPKPLIPIGDIPIMERIIDKFRDFGVQNFYATLNYRKNMIKSYFSEIMEGYEITYVEESQPLGTGGSLHLIEETFDKPIIVSNCDILIHADYGDIYNYHLESGNDMTIVSALKNILVPYGVIRSKENGGVLSIEEKPQLSYFINTGMYIINPQVIKLIPKDTFYHMTDLADKLLENGQRVGMYPISEDSFLDMGEFEEMHRMEQKLNLKVED